MSRVEKYAAELRWTAARGLPVADFALGLIRAIMRPAPGVAAAQQVAEARDVLAALDQVSREGGDAR